MRKHTILCMLLAAVLTGCGNVTGGTDTTTTEESAYLTENEKDTEAAQWEASCEEVRNALLGISWVQDVELAPADYQTYAEDKQMHLYITPVADTELTEQKKESLQAYVENANVFAQYEIVYREQ